MQRREWHNKLRRKSCNQIRICFERQVLVFREIEFVSNQQRNNNRVDYCCSLPLQFQRLLAFINQSLICLAILEWNKWSLSVWIGMEHSYVGMYIIMLGGQRSIYRIVQRTHTLHSTKYIQIKFCCVCLLFEIITNNDSNSVCYFCSFYFLSSVPQSLFIIFIFSFSLG